MSWVQMSTDGRQQNNAGAIVEDAQERPSGSPKNRAKNSRQTNIDDVETGLADTLIYLTRLADKLDVDLLAAAISKIKLNEQKYPVKKAKGNAQKYTEYG